MEREEKTAGGKRGHLRTPDSLGCGQPELPKGSLVLQAAGFSRPRTTSDLPVLGFHTGSGPETLPRVPGSQHLLWAAAPRAHLGGHWAFRGARNEGTASPS